jgi:hypothetical protein
MSLRNLLACAMLATVSMALAAPADADTYVHGYTRRDGTYVQPHYRSSPDSSTFNNWSSRGNMNPHTGEYGTRDPYRYQPSPTFDRPLMGPGLNLNPRW